MAAVVTVAGVTRTSNTQRFELRRPINGVGAGTMTFVDRSGSSSPWAPAVLDEVIVEVDGTRVFRGRVLTRESKFVVENRRGYVVTDCQVADVNDRLGLELINVPVAGGTLKSVLQNSIMLVLPAGQGITLDPAQADGPTVDDQVFAWSYCRDCADHLSQLTGWIWRVEEVNLYFGMWAIGSRSSGVAFSEANRNIQTITVAQDATGYRNVQWVVFGPTQDGVAVEEVFTNDGVNRNYDLNYALNGGSAPLTVTRSDTGATLSVDGLEWSYNAGLNRVVHTGGTPVANGATLTVAYVVGFPQYIVETDAAEVAANGDWVRKDEYPLIFDYVQASNTALALIRNNKPRPQRLRLTTRASGVDPGEVCSVSLPELGIATADFLATAVTCRYFPWVGGTHRVEFELELIGGTERQVDWVDFWRDIVGGTGAGGGSGVSGGAGGGGSTTGGPGAHFLGGSDRQSVTHSAQVTVPEAVAVELDSASYPTGAVTVRCELRTSNAATTVRARLVRLDTLAAVGESDVVSSTTWTRVKFPATLVSGVQWYALYLVPSNASNPVQGKGGYLA